MPQEVRYALRLFLCVLAVVFGVPLALWLIGSAL